MALPKRKVSKSRQGKRRAHWKLRKPGLSICPECEEPKMPHRICPSCGYYKGRKILEVE